MTTHSAHAPIEQVLRDAGIEDPGLAATIAALIPESEALTRRLLIARSQSAFKEGFGLGKRWPKCAPYVADIWRKSDFYSRHFAERRAHPEDQARYARYNDF